MRPVPPGQVWYHGNISRLKAEELLGRAKKDGCFLVRDSESVKGAFALCVLYHGAVHQYRILQDADELLALQTIRGVQEQRFSSLQDLVTQNSSRTDVLVCPLKEAVQQDQSEEDSDDDEDEDSLTPVGDFSKSRTDTVSQVFQMRLEQLRLSRVDNGFVGQLRQYVQQGLQQDMDGLRTGGSSLPQLHRLVELSAQELHGHFESFLAKMDTMRQLFDQTTPGKHRKASDPVKVHDDQGQFDLQELLERLATCKTVITSLERKASRVLQEFVQPEGESENRTKENFPKGEVAKSPPPSIPPKTFEVRQESLGAMKSSRLMVKVDVMNGKLYCLRSPKSPEEVFTHKKILQLVKSPKARLGVKIEDQKGKYFVFEDVRSRELFCQLIQHMKNIHSKDKEVDQISVFVGTWNMGDAPAPSNISSWFKCQGQGKTRDETFALVPFDVYVIGTQESAVGEKDWVQRLQLVLWGLAEIKYQPVAVSTLWGLRLVVLVKPEHQHRISHVQTSSVKTGIANALGNKGAVGIAFLFWGTAFCFINCHLTSGNEKCTRRNQNYHDILRGLNLGHLKLGGFDVTTQFHHVFFLGDLNYRLDLPVQEILKKVNERDYESLLTHDQLKVEQDKGRIFVRFNEENITFPPTYRYERGNRKEYTWQKFKKTGIRINVPSWCDRVLWRSFPDTYITSLSYGCTEDIVTSDHSPVFASFDVGITTQYVSKKDLGGTGGADNKKVEIVFKHMDAKIKTSSKTSFYLEIHSTCLEGPSQSTTVEGLKDGGNIKASWSSNHLPLLSPLISDWEYLEEQHLLLSVKSADSDESYGECVLSLKNMIASMPQQFDSFITHLGECTGTLSGWMHVKGDERIRSQREMSRSYELISFGEMVEDTSDHVLPHRHLQPTLSNPLDGTVHKPVTSTSSLTATNEMYFLTSGVDDKQQEGPQLTDSQRKKPKPTPRRRGSSLERDVRTRESPGLTVDEQKQRSHSSDRLADPMEVRPPKPPPRLSSSRLASERRPRDRKFVAEPKKQNAGAASPPVVPNKPPPVVRVTKGDDEANSDIPPPLPVKSRGNRTSMASLSDIPLSPPHRSTQHHEQQLADWLSQLGLIVYHDKMVRAGWDRLEFLDDITEQDLIDIGMTMKEQREHFLSQVKKRKETSI
ncbi:phosphatidylinositol 3,4,5-trisphosphate 5-phosphatase 2-like isoform X1 [Branchiostoma lanceolatum]|uniref:phosphatidylinositol 3,4,5-trisphosphate 5-phosphatase 2-like isoform X1 n=1 Tax=Branchiostoma lanceolatum TaxID=7740 RepID=UPI0034520E57